MIDGIADRATFDLLRRAERITVGAIWLRHHDDGRGLRVAYALGRHLGNAVTRNRARRRIAAVLGDLDRAGSLPAGAYLVGARPSVNELSFEKLAASLEEAVARLGGSR